MKNQSTMKTEVVQKTDGLLSSCRGSCGQFQSDKWLVGNHWTMAGLVADTQIQH